MWYFGYSRYPMKVRTRSIIALVSAALDSPSGVARTRRRSSRSFSCASRRPCSKRRPASPGSKFLTLERIMGRSVDGLFAPPRPRDVDLADAAHAVRVEVGRNGVLRFLPAREGGERVQESVVRDLSRKATTSGYGRIASATSRRASPISDVTLWGTDCVRMSTAFFSPSHASICSLIHCEASMAVRDHLKAVGSEHDPLELRDVRCDEVEERQSGLGPDVALHGGEGGCRRARSAR